MGTIRKIQGGIAKASLAVAAVIMATVAVAIFTNVFCRFVLQKGLMWVEMYARYMLLWSVFLAANVLIYRNDLMRVDFMDDMWPAKFKKVREIIYTIIFIIMLLILVKFGMDQALDYRGVELMALHVDKFWVYLCIPVGSALMLVQYILNLICDFMKDDKGGAEKV